MSSHAIIFINKNLKIYVAFAVFFGVLICLTAIRQVFQQVDNPICYRAYAAGYAIGNFVWTAIEN
jgi:hypothetical protein